MARITISVPDGLARRLEPLKDRVNVSSICQTALEARVETFERIAALSEEDIMEKLVQRLRIEKDEGSGWSYKRGGEDGQEWAIDGASYSELVEWTNPDLLHAIRQGQHFLNGVPFPESAEDRHNDAEASAKEAGEAFDHDAYATGFLEAMGEVWLQVRDRI